MTRGQGCREVTDHRFGAQRQRGFTILELSVSLALLAVLLGVFLERWLTTQEIAEKTAMQATARVFAGAVRFKVAELMIHGQLRRLPVIAEENPADWLEVKPPNYFGTVADPRPGKDRTGGWYFDPQRKELVYLVNLGFHFKPDAAGLKRVRYRVALLAGDAAPGALRPAGARLEPVEPYRWFRE